MSKEVHYMKKTNAIKSLWIQLLDREVFMHNQSLQNVPLSNIGDVRSQQNISSNATLIALYSHLQNPNVYCTSIAKRDCEPRFCPFIPQT